jgi:hypothetical protein
MNGGACGRYVSAWWRDLCAIDDFIPDKNWFENAIDRRVLNGASTLFWSQRWLGESTLEQSFPRLFSLSVDKEAKVRELAVIGDDNIEWNLSWRRGLFAWEEILVHDLRALLSHVNLSVGTDFWRWKADSDGLFSVRSAYSLLLSEVLGAADLGGRANPVFERIWKSPAPSKLIAFSWQLLHNRIPTKDNLVSRGILRGDASGSCVMCTGSVETASHLFLHCNFVFSIWLVVFRWLGVTVVMPADLSTLFGYFVGFARTKKARRGFMLVWHTTIWQIWRSRNEVIFNNKVTSAADYVEEIKVLSWKWSAHKLKILPCLFYEWVWDPGDCFNR